MKSGSVGARSRLAAGIGIVLFVCAALYVYAAHQAGRRELRELCEQGVHPKVYAKASAAGYFDGGISCIANGCWHVLTGSGYRFIEFEKRDSNKWDIIPEDGFYRLSKARLDSGQCDRTVLAEMKEHKSSIYTRFLDEGNCLVLQKIERVEARYALNRVSLPAMRIDNHFGSVISKANLSIRDNVKGELVAERNTYLLNQNSLPSFSSFPNVVGCQDVGVVSMLPNIGSMEFYVNPE